jgi:arabinofuranan 3-O-arabinosyltransferase
MPVKLVPADRPSVFAMALIALWALALPTGIGTPQGWITDSQGMPIVGDYTGVYAAGKLTLRGEPLAAYDWERHKAAQHELDGNPKGAFYPWPYPPSLLLVAAALALLPYYLSMLAWTLATFAAFFAAIARITTSRRDMLLMLAAPAAWLNLYIGQNGALTAALVGFGLILLPARPVAAGICIGLLSIKPHLGILIPVALLAGGYYRAFAAAALTVATLALITTAAFGVEPWLALPEQLQRVATLAKTTSSTEKIQSLFGIARSLGVSADHALWLQGALIAALVATIAWLWSRRDVDFDLKAAALAAAMTLASPYQFVYDLVILTIAQAFLLRHFAGTRVEPAETYAIVIANVVVFLFATTPVPLGAVASAIVLGLILRRVWTNRAVAADDEKLSGPCLSATLPAHGA